jgi:hypothetical protein
VTRTHRAKVCKLKKKKKSQPPSPNPSPRLPCALGTLRARTHALHSAGRTLGAFCAFLRLKLEKETGGDKCHQSQRLCPLHNVDSKKKKRTTSVGVFLFFFFLSEPPCVITRAWAHAMARVSFWPNLLILFLNYALGVC